MGDIRRQIACWLLAVLHGGTIFASDATLLYDGFVLERQLAMESDSNGCRDLQWTFDQEAKDITFSVTSVPGASWVGIGISNNGGMKGADIAMIRKDPDDGRFTLEDLFSHDYVQPQKDVVQNVELLHATVDDEDRMQVVIRRHADTCDKDDLAVTGVKQSLICASGSVDSEGNPLFHGSQRSNS